MTTNNTHNRQTSMPPVGFEPTISAGERPKTYALDRAATGTGIHFTIILIFKSRSSKLSLSLSFPFETLYANLLSPIHVICPANLIHLDLITRIIFGEKYRSSGCSLRNIFQSLLPHPCEAQLSSSASILKSTRPTLLPQCERQSFAPILTHSLPAI